MLNTKRNELFNKTDIVNSNDLRKRIVNIDSRFRETASMSTTDFYHRFENPYKNIIRARVASVEIPNMYYNFSEKNYGNTSFIINAYDYNTKIQNATIKIEDGNYVAVDLIAIINDLVINVMLTKYGIVICITSDPFQIKTEIIHYGTVQVPVPPTAQLPWPPVATAQLPWPPTPASWAAALPTGKYGVYNIKPARPFQLDFRIPRYMDRLYNWGLGFNLGFRNRVYNVNTPGDASGSVYIKSESCIDIVGDMYCFLSVDDFFTVEQTTNDNTFQCLAKVIIREDKGNVIYDDGSTVLSNDVIFPSPIDLKQVRIRLLNPYGNVLDLNDMSFSISLEITEVMNTKLYEFYRNYIWLGQIPQVPQDVRGSAMPLLGGKGP